MTRPPDPSERISDNYSTIPTHLQVRKRTPFYRMQTVLWISLVLTVLVLLLLLFFFMTVIPKYSGTQTYPTKGKPAPDAALTEEVLFMARNGKGMFFRPSLLKSEQYGYDAKQPVTPHELTVITLRHNLFSHHYLVSSDTLILLGDFDPAKILSLHQAPKVLILRYGGTWYHLRRTGDGIRILEEEVDSSVIDLCHEK